MLSTAFFPLLSLRPAYSTTTAKAQTYRRTNIQPMVMHPTPPQRSHASFQITPCAEERMHSKKERCDAIQPAVCLSWEQAHLAFMTPCPDFTTWKFSSFLHRTKDGRSVGELPTNCRIFHAHESDWFRRHETRS